MELQKIIFYLLLVIQIIGGIMLVAVNFGILNYSIISVICFAIFFFISPFLLVLSISEFIRDKENVMMSSIGVVVALGGIVIVVITFIEMTKLM